MINPLGSNEIEDRREDGTVAETAKSRTNQMSGPNHTTSAKSLEKGPQTAHILRQTGGRFGHHGELLSMH